MIVKLPSDECHWTLLMISQHWLRWWLGAVRQQAITWANFDPDLSHHMASLGPNELKFTSTACEITLRWMPQNTLDNKSTLVEVMACHWPNVVPYLCCYMTYHWATMSNWVRATFWLFLFIATILYLRDYDKFNLLRSSNTYIPVAWPEGHHWFNGEILSTGIPPKKNKKTKNKTKQKKTTFWRNSVWPANVSLVSLFVGKWCW